MPTTIVRYSVEERAERRKQIAEYVRKHGDVSEAARKFGVCRDLVKSACKIHDVPFMEPNMPHPKTYGIIAALLFDNITNEEAARRFKLTKQRIHTIRTAMRKAGIPFGIRGVLNGSKARSKLETRVDAKSKLKKAI